MESVYFRRVAVLESGRIASPRVGVRHTEADAVVHNHILPAEPLAKQAVSTRPSATRPSALCSSLLHIMARLSSLTSNQQPGDFTARSPSDSTTALACASVRRGLVDGSCTCCSTVCLLIMITRQLCAPSDQRCQCTNCIMLILLQHVA